MSLPNLLSKYNNLSAAKLRGYVRTSCEIRINLAHLAGCVELNASTPKNYPFDLLSFRF